MFFIYIIYVYIYIILWDSARPIDSDNPNKFLLDKVIILVARRSIKNRNETCLFKFRKRKTDSFYKDSFYAIEYSQVNLNDFVGGVCNLVISVDCPLNYSHHKYNTNLYNRAKGME